MMISRENRWPAVFCLFCLTLLGQTSALAADAGEVMRPVIAESSVAVERLTPEASDGHAGLAFLRKPPGDGPFPAVILIHGGAPGWDEATLRDYATHIHASRYLEAGYVVVALTRRDLDLNLGFDDEQKPVLDVLAVYDHVSDLPYVDADSVVVRGTSVGGYLTLEVAANRNPAAIVVEEPFSFPFVGVRLGPEGQNQPPLTDKIDRITSPIFLIRGDQTANLNDFNRLVMIPAIGQADKGIDVVTFPGGLHSFAFYDNAERTPDPAMSLEAFRLIDRFFRLHLETAPQAMDASLVDHEAVSY